MNDQPVTIEQDRWAPVSAGEYDRRLRKVSVNLTVVDEVVARFGHDRAVVVAAIVAHEQVHVCSTPEALPHEEELRARAAAAEAAGAEVVAHIDEVLAGAWV
ncbi:hypothetical protein TBR22_A46280 [Luteitalea sp. TBR-22]|uniref:hypothetical protein n=1 Tax=Luteitalea sp. TBR-22 TaxID=2802971 RepID=UPI001AF2B26C|nr:hypothetical protein [Luteitalea sp. TBR-22]BCS35401.1 hypothetical protein TBR22_A46280 [Luteitalea sp. TBR-22]